MIPFLSTTPWVVALAAPLVAFAAGGDYRWTWLVCGTAILASIPAMAPLHDEQR
jgi:hypothetical protein